jgi:hypothetical protein
MGDTVRVKLGARPEARPGALAEVVGVRTVENEAQAQRGPTDSERLKNAQSGIAAPIAAAISTLTRIASASMRPGVRSSARASARVASADVPWPREARPIVLPSRSERRQRRYRQQNVAL